MMEPSRTGKFSKEFGVYEDKDDEYFMLPTEQLSPRWEQVRQILRGFSIIIFTNILRFRLKGRPGLFSVRFEI
jgi:hypothetical protein